MGRTGELRPLILHVSGDFPDPIVETKTPVIRALIDLTNTSFDHRVISINRTDPGIAGSARELVLPQQLEVSSQDFEYGTALSYEAPGKGIRHWTKLTQLGSWLANKIMQMERQPDLLIGHKLTIEGIVVAHASQLCGIPYALSIQGNTDAKILNTRRDLAAKYKDIFQEAKTVFPFTPWALNEVEDRLGKRSKRTALLPCPTELDRPTPPRNGGTGFVSVFHLRNHANKNLAGMVEAMKTVSQAHPDQSLDIIGGGSPADQTNCQNLIEGRDGIRLSGPASRTELPPRLNQATAFVMPSFRESFGLVFVEALFAGIPIIYPRGTAIDGYFDGSSFAIGVDAHSPKDIAQAMLQCIENEAEVKAELAQWQGSDHARQFTQSAIAKTFADGLLQALEA